MTKAYATRVGEGPFPTELRDERGRALRDVGREFGTTTGRERRCGWLDLVALRYAVRVNGMTGLVITKLDVLNGFDEIEVCTAYRHGSDVIDEMPRHQSVFHKVQPVYERLPGWNTDISAARSLADLPKAARDFLDFVSRHTETPLTLVSVGPRREETIRLV